MTELERWLAEYARGTVEEWLRRPGTPPITEGGDETSQYRMVWQEDGSVVLERDGQEWLRFEMEISFRTVGANRPDETYPVEEERPWCGIPARWEVQAPDGKWYRIISTVQRDGKQYVYLDMGNGEGREWPRNPADKVTCRPGTPVDETDKALAALGRVEIIEDQVS